MNETHLGKVKTIHCIGIGGIGMSALARLFLFSGKTVTGSDSARTVLTDELAKEGVSVFLGHARRHVTDGTDAVIYSPAIPEENPERVEAAARGIRVYSYPEALGSISSGKRTIAVSGTHGKTTTTALLSHILLGAKKDPTVIVGGLLKEYGSNFIHGSSDIFVAEACEYCRSFLHLSPEILLITNIDEDHLDYYRDLADIQSAFAELVRKVPTEGAIICNPKDVKTAPALSGVRARIIDYTTVPLSAPLPTMGEHNKENARAAIAASSFLGVPEEEAARLLESFSGTARRAEYRGESAAGAFVYDDYAHHPAEIARTLEGFRAARPGGRLVVVFQPHLFSRTKLLLGAFAKSFTAADRVIVVDIYAARESDDGSIHSRDLAASIGPLARYAGDFQNALACVKEESRAGDTIITMGAGNVYRIAETLTGGGV